MSDSVISLDASLPLAWEESGRLPPSAIEQRNHANLSLLKALAAIDTATQERDEAPEAIRKHLDRVESKLDVLLLLLAKLTLDNTQLPPDCDVKLSQLQITWKPHQAVRPVVGETITIRLFLTTRIPQPLTLQAVVRNSVSDQISADLQGLDDELEEWLTRTIFRYHRRAVHARKQP